jgi:hypothetical protein
VPKGLPVGHSPRRPRHLLVMNPDPKLFTSSEVFIRDRLLNDFIGSKK